MMPQMAAVAGRRVISSGTMRQRPPEVKAVLENQACHALSCLPGGLTHRYGNLR
jgi:hypothetical protein